MPRPEAKELSAPFYCEPRKSLITNRIVSGVLRVEKSEYYDSSCAGARRIQSVELSRGDAVAMGIECRFELRFDGGKRGNAERRRRKRAAASTGMRLGVLSAYEINADKRRTPESAQGLPSAQKSHDQTASCRES